MTPSEARVSSTRLAFLLLFATSLMWAGNVIVGRAVRLDVPPVALSFARWMIAAALLLPFTWRELWQKRALISAHRAILLLLALLGMTIYNLLSYTAVARTEAVNAAVVISFMPIQVVLVAWLIGEESISRRQIVGIVISMLGVGLIAVRGSLGLLLALEFQEGDLWMLGAGVIWGLYTAYYTRRPLGLSQLGLLCTLVLIGLLGLIPFLLWEISSGASVVWNARGIAGMAYVGVFSATLAYFCWNWGVAVVGPARAAVFLHLIPVFAIGLAVFFLGEKLHWYHFVGVPLVFLGLWQTTGTKS